MGRGHCVQGKNHRPLEIVHSNSPGILEPGAAQSWEPRGSAQEGAVLSQGEGWMGDGGDGGSTRSSFKNFITLVNSVMTIGI